MSFDILGFYLSARIFFFYTVRINQNKDLSDQNVAPHLFDALPKETFNSLFIRNRC